MIADDKLNRLSTLIGLHKATADHLGAEIFTRAHRVVNADLVALLDELDVDEKRFREKTPHEIRTTGNAEKTDAPIPPVERRP